MPVIAMTREMGSKGKDIALGLAQRLNIPIVHHNLVERDISEKLHISESDVHHHLEGKTSLLERWRFPGKVLANMTACEVYELAEHDNVIIRGWGSTQLLHSIDHVLCVRVCAPLEQRIATLMERLELHWQCLRWLMTNTPLSKPWQLHLSVPWGNNQTWWQLMQAYPVCEAKWQE